MKPTFDEFMEQLKPTNVGLDFFTNFEKVHYNVQKIEMYLNSLNYLLGKKDINKAIATLYETNPKCLSVIDILIAVRWPKKKQALNDQGDCILLKSYLDSLSGIQQYIQETGLAEVFKKQQVKSLVDYVFGVEVGLDSNARKNRGGTCMENAVADLLRSYQIKFKEQVNTTSMEKLTWLGKDVKQFDFVIELSEKTYLVETNFYSSGGSKLNETARSYINLENKVKEISDFEFVWITDGLGWDTAKNKLSEAYTKIPHVYNLTSVKAFLSTISSNQ